MILSNFPPEILYAILRNLDLKSFLTVQKTCKALRSAANDRTLWYGFVQEFEARPGHSRLEAPWTDYTTEELAQWVLRRFRVEKIWRTLSAPKVTRPPCSPKFREFDADGDDSTLLPGGRWLLMLDCLKGKIYVVDLERPELESEILIEGDGDNVEGMQWFWAFWVDFSKPRLSVRVALWQRWHGSSMNSWEPHEVSIPIYNVELVGHGPGAKLRAEHMTSVHHSSPGRYMTATLDGEHFLEIQRGHNSQVTIVKYCDNGRPIQSEPTTMPIGYWSFTSVHLVWGERIVVFAGEFIVIYSLNHMGRGRLSEEARTLHCFWCRAIAMKMLGSPPSEKFDVWKDKLSAPIVLPESVRFTFAAKNRVWGFSVPRDITVSPVLKCIADAPFPRLVNAGMGDRHWLFLDMGKRSIDMISCTWGNPRAEPRSSRRTITGARGFPDQNRRYWDLLPAGYSEELGRMVAYEQFKKTCIVLDII